MIEVLQPAPGERVARPDVLPVNEVFETIQGEATHAGRPAVFVRLQGCPIGCPWCDTKHTWQTDLSSMALGLGAVLLKDASDETWADAPLDELVELVSRYRARHVVFTGGEPCIHDLTAPSAALLNTGRSVQVETSGTHEVRIDQRAWVTVSPKLNMPGGFEVRDDALARADEIKMPVGKPADIENLFALLARGAHRPEVPVWLQPLSMSQRATELCKASAIANGLRVSLQLHALAGWR
jgi:7-carboxy-7-deazaguanine synthase